jgi:hypothetical protein
MNKFPNLLLTIFIALLVPSLSRADAVFTVGNNPQPNEENVLLNSGTIGNTIQGTTNQNGFVVNFTSGTQLLTAPSNGQARVEATNNGSQVALTDVSFSLANSATFTDAIFNMFVGGTIGAPGGDAMITALTNDGTFTFDLTLGNGQNFLTVTTTGGEVLTDISISTDIGFTDLRQVRISGATPAVPEPGVTAFCFAGATLLGLGLLRRKLTRA